jgi:hypothetical protein
MNGARMQCSNVISSRPGHTKLVIESNLRDGVILRAYPVRPTINEPMFALSR